MDEVRKALKNLAKSQEVLDQERTIPFDEFLVRLRRYPERMIRNVHQVFHDMVKTYVGEGHDEYPGDPESINFIGYDCSRLFVEGSDQPFFADRIFANRLMSMIEGLRGGAQQNKIYLFDGPPGSGKSTFLNNLLRKFEEYANSPEGCRYEVVWRLDRSLLEGDLHGEVETGGRLSRLLDRRGEGVDASDMPGRQRYLEVPCPSHDNPLLMVPRELRSQFLDGLFANDQFKWNLSTGKEYDWVFRDDPCTICSSLYKALLHKLGDPVKVLEMIHARPYRFDRRLGEELLHDLDIHSRVGLAHQRGRTGYMWRGHRRSAPVLSTAGPLPVPSGDGRVDLDPWSRDIRLDPGADIRRRVPGNGTAAREARNHVHAVCRADADSARHVARAAGRSG